jgi:chromosome segregation ATPase
MSFIASSFVTFIHQVGTDGAEDAEKLVRLELQIAELQTRLTTVLEESEANSRTLKHELEDAHLQHNVAIEEKNNLSLQIAQLSGELDSLRSELSNRQHTVAEFESQVRMNDSTLPVAHDFQMASLSAASQSDSTAARNRILEVEEVLSKVSEENSTISKLLEDSKRSLMTSENERILWDEERVKLLRAAADTEASFAEATKELENARSLIADLKSKGETNSSLQADYQSLKADRDSHLQRASELEVEILELKEDLENLQESLLTKTDSARHAQEELESRIKLHDESVATSLAKVGELSSMLAQEKALHAKDLNESKSELESIAKQLRDMEQRVVDVEKDKELAQQKLSELALSHEASSAGTQQRHSEEMAEIRAREQV